MKKKKKILKIVLIVLVAIFVVTGLSAMVMVKYRKTVQEEQRRKAALEALESVPKVTPTPAVTATPVPTATPAPTPTPEITIVPAFNPDDYWDTWYSTDGLVTINIYDISLKSVSFTYTQTDKKQSQTLEADVTAEVAGNASKLSFKDSLGNKARANIIFDNGQLYVKVRTKTRGEGAVVVPVMECIMVREQPYVEWEEEEPTPTPQEKAETETQQTAQPGDYYFPESSDRYLTDEEVSVYSASDLELAKNEIYARHGRIFVTEHIADYFNSKSWYQGTIDAQTFDSQQDSIFNEYELANIAKISEWEAKNSQ